MFIIYILIIAQILIQTLGIINASFCLISNGYNPWVVGSIFQHISIMILTLIIYNAYIRILET